MKIRKAVIPAAGLGTRMLPASKSVPKEMLPIVDKPAIQYIIEEAVTSGIEDILVITNRGKSAIEDHFDYAPDLELSLKSSEKSLEFDSVRYTAELANIYYVRQKDTKGLGHAVWCARRFIGNQPFAVLLGDDIMVGDPPVTKQLIDAANKYDATVVGAQSVNIDDISKYCSLKVSELENNIYRVSDLIEKPSPDKVFSNFAILGRYVLMPEIFTALENTSPGYGGEIQLTDGLALLCKSDPIVAVDFDGRRYDTGNLPGFLEATIDFALKDPNVGAWFREFIKERVKEDF